MRPASVFLFLLATGCCLAVGNIWARLPAYCADLSRIDSLLLYHSLLPRIAVGWVAGAMLGLAGLLFQQLLRNPIAEPATIGVAAGAQFALTFATLAMPTLLGFGRELVAIAGAGIAFTLVLALARRRDLAPSAVIIAGLVVTSCASSAIGVLVIMNHDYLGDLFIWQSGLLAQSGWRSATLMLPVLCAIWPMATALRRPFELLSLRDDNAGSLGLSSRFYRLLGLLLGVVLSAVVVASVGVIGFIGLLAPLLARLTGARRFKDRILWAPAFGGALLSTCDQLTQMLFRSEAVPVGVTTAVVGGPILLAYVRRLSIPAVGFVGQDRAAWPATHINVGAVGKLIALAIALFLTTLFLGRGSQGWSFASPDQLIHLLPWRLPRHLAAFSSGAALGIAGVIIQRLTSNSIASPEILGASSGASVATIAVIYLFPTVSLDSRLLMLSSGTGALVVCGFVLFACWRGTFSGERLLLTGLALTTVTSALIALLITAGNDRTGFILSWLGGSTYRVTMGQALSVTGALVIALLLLPLTSRWLRMFPLGPAATRSLGLEPGKSAFLLLIVCCCLSAAATVVVGPLSFIGLMAPQIARMSGVRQPVQQIYASSAIGGVLMLLSDWLGRTAFFPWQVPGGLLAALCAGPFLLCLLRRGGH